MSNSFEEPWYVSREQYLIQLAQDWPIVIVASDSYHGNWPAIDLHDVTPQNTRGDCSANFVQGDLFVPVMVHLFSGVTNVRDVRFKRRHARAAALFKLLHG